MSSPAGPDSSPRGNIHREGTRVILREITTTLQESTSPKMPTNKAAVEILKTPKHEIKVQFAREFLEVTEDPSSQISNTLSTASSCQSLTSTLSTKSSSGICPDSPIRSSDVSYANADISGLDDILSACAGIRLEDSCIDSSFVSANDESAIELTENLPVDGTFNFEEEEINKSQESFILQLDETREIGELNVDPIRDAIEPVLDQTVHLNETFNCSGKTDVEVHLTPDKTCNLSPRENNNSVLSQVNEPANQTILVDSNNLTFSPDKSGNLSTPENTTNDNTILSETIVQAESTSETAFVDSNSQTFLPDKSSNSSELSAPENNTILSEVQVEATSETLSVNSNNHTFSPDKSGNLSGPENNLILSETTVQVEPANETLLADSNNLTFSPDKSDNLSAPENNIVLSETEFKVETTSETLLVDSNNKTFLPNSNVDSVDSVTNNCEFDKLKSEAQRLANDLYNTSLVCSDDNEEFVPASSELFPDLMSVDLSNFNSENTKARSNDRLRSESLYVKFDPLVSNMLPQGGNIDATPSTNNDEKINGDKEVVHTPPKKNPAIDAIDRLLFYSPLPNSTSKKEEPEKIEQREKNPEPTPVIDSTMAKELELVRSSVLQLQEQLEQQKINHDKEVQKLQEDKLKAEEKNESLQMEKNLLKKELAQEIKSKNQITVVIDEYEKSISRLVAEKERDRIIYDGEKSRLYSELDDCKAHLAASESAFNDVHAKYEKLKIVVTEARNNEQVLKESIQENIEIIKSLEYRYQQIKSHAAEKLEKANLELDMIRKQNESDLVKLRAMLQKEELKSNSLAGLVEQKTRENNQLTQIFDELVARVGPRDD